LEIQNYSARHINALIKKHGNDLEWKFTGIYDNPEITKRNETWAPLRHLSQTQPKPFLCVGDFNEILTIYKKNGSARLPHSQMEAFKRKLEDCQLSDLGSKGPQFTWNNGRFGRDFTMERLNKGVTNLEWCDIHGFVVVSVLASTSSDHHPILITYLSPNEIQWHTCRKFRAENRWNMLKDYKPTIHRIWKAKTGTMDTWKTIRGKLQSWQSLLQKWMSVTDHNT
jgi:hypothetical protein